MGYKDLTDKQWSKLSKKIEEVCSKRGKGRPWKNNRQTINAILKVLYGESSYRSLPREQYGPWSTAASRLNRWQEAGIWDEIWQSLIDIGVVKKPKPAIDSFIVQAHPDATGAKKKDRD